MTRNFVIAFLTFWLIVAINGATLSVPLTPSETYTHKLIVDENRPDLYQLFWRVEGEEVTFEVHCRTTGWVGIGISTNGGMTGADIGIGWVDDSTGKGTLKDCHALSFTAPIVDKHQDWFLLDAAQKDGYTMLKMKRKLFTCDEQDKEIMEGSTIMIFAWHKDDPVDGTNWLYHAGNRRTKTALLLNYKEASLQGQEADLPADTTTFDIRPTVNVPAKDTTYYCEVFKLPVYKTDMHLVKFEVLMNKANVDIVHHYDVYECDEDYEHTEPLAQECGDISLPDYVNEKCNNRMFATWSIGGQYNYSFPQVAGYRLLKANKVKYIMIQVHYDNYNMHKGRIDNTGIRYYVSPTLRKYDLGLMSLGNMGSNGALSFTVPPLTKSITFTSICYAECTNEFPEEGITAIGGVMHTHLLGRSVRSALIRNNKLVANLLYNPNFDFNYQYIFDSKPIKINRGDVLLTQCTYSSESLNNFTFIGYSSREEMCFTFLYYYPASKVIICGSAPSVPDIKTFYTSLMKESLIPKFEFNDTDFRKQQKDIAKMLQREVKGSKQLSEKYTKFFESLYMDTPKCLLDDDDKEYKARRLYAPEDDLTIKKCLAVTFHVNLSSLLFTTAIIGFLNLF